MKNKFHEQYVRELGSYLTKIKADYHRWQDRCQDGDDSVKDMMFDEFCEKLTYTVGRNYIKIISNDSAHSFIVAKETKGFKKGDILHHGMLQQQTSQEVTFLMKKVIQLDGQEHFNA
jgi:hypothetical protein